MRVPNVRTLQALTVEEQMEELSALFNVADFNNDGSVDKYELVRLIGCCVLLRAAWCRCVVLLRGAVTWCCCVVPLRGVAEWSATICALACAATCVECFYNL